MLTFEYKKGKEGRQLSDHFHSSEFDCLCGNCITTLVDLSLIINLEKLREALGSSIKVTSGYRCAQKQEQLRLLGYETARGISQHELGKAADITNGVTLGHELEDLARKAGFESVGVGHNWIHVDLRPGYRRWVYAKS